MYRSVYDLRSFYSGKVGRVVRRVLQERIRGFWPETRGLRIMGCGYATPYLRAFMEDAERIIGLMPAGQGAHHWPMPGIKAHYNATPPERNLVALTEEAELPIETNSIDRALLIHDLEFSERPDANLDEIWRVLKSNGRLLIIAPNRRGLWARAEWSPFGHGAPYTASQLHHHLRDNRFIHERTEEALFMPPVKFSLFLQSAKVFERIGQNYMPFAAGVHMVEATKQLYARADHGSGARVTVRRRVFAPKPIPQV